MLVQTVMQSRRLFGAVAVFGFLVNLLMLAGPLYILNVYDRVLSSRSVETLVALTLLLAFLYVIMGTLDFVRGRIMARVGARFQSSLDRRVLDATIKVNTLRHPPRQAVAGPQDLDAVHRLIVSPALMFLFDLPWVPLFLFGIFVFHPLLGVLALCGAATILLLAVMNQWAQQRPLKAGQAIHLATTNVDLSARTESEMISATGMHSAVLDRWQKVREQALARRISATDKSGVFLAIARSYRLFLQSAMMGLGAYLVLQDQLSAGAMIASSILMARALAPLEGVVAQWDVIQRGRDGWSGLALLLECCPQDRPHLSLPRPQAKLSVDQVAVVPPDARAPAIRFLSLEVDSGSVVGIIGPSGSGKSALGLAMTGVWPLAAGQIRLDGVPLARYGTEALGRHIGYLPQRVQLFDGTIKENIARMSATPEEQRVRAAAKAAAAHDMIACLPHGYDTVVSAAGAGLSGGAIQRIALARILYGNPVVVILDEPYANLDHDGGRALSNVIAGLRAEGRIVFIISHRPSAIESCDLLLVMENGVRKAFGPRSRVLAEFVRNHRDVTGNMSTVGDIA